jgi:hypothetical protein
MMADVGTTRRGPRQALFWLAGVEDRGPQQALSCPALRDGEGETWKSGLTVGPQPPSTRLCQTRELELFCGRDPERSEGGSPQAKSRAPRGTQPIPRYPATSRDIPPPSEFFLFFCSRVTGFLSGLGNLQFVICKVQKSEVAHTPGSYFANYKLQIAN